MFNLIDIYGDSQLDPVRQEYIVSYVAGSLARERAARRAATFRKRSNTNKAAGKELVKHAWSKAQLAALAQASLTKGESFTLQEISTVPQCCAVV